MVKRGIHEIVKDFRQKNPNVTCKTENSLPKHNKRFSFDKFLFHTSNSDQETDFFVENNPFNLLKENLRKRDCFVLLIYYILMIVYLWKFKEFPFGEAIIGAIGLFIMVSWFLLFCALFISICAFFLSIFIQRVFLGKRKGIFEKFLLEKRFESFSVRIWLFLWNVLTLSFLFKVPFKGKSGSFGGGGASGKI